MINAPDPLVLGDKRRNIKLIYEKDGDKHTPIWKLEGISNREQRLIADLNIDDLAGVAAGERFGEGFAYVLANPLTDPAQISEQRKVMDVDHPFDTLDGIVDAMYALGHHMEMLDSSSFKDENKIAHRLKFLGAYVGLLACLKANFKDSDAQPLASIGAYAEEVLNTVPFLQLPDVARATEKFFRVTFEVTEPIVGQGEPKILRAEYIGHRINPVEMMRELGHRIKASFIHYGRSYTSQVLALIDTIVKDAIAPAQETLSLLPALEFYRCGREYNRLLGQRESTYLGFSSNGSSIQALRQPLDALNGDHSTPNDYGVSGDERTILITGAHDGGKSYYAKSVGVHQSAHQRGLKVPASSGQVETSDAIYTHFVAQDDPVKGEGRQTYELSRIDEILDNCSPRSLVIVDEPGGATNPEEGQELSADLLRALAGTRARVIFVTHYHGLAQVGEEHPAIANMHPDSRVEDGVLVHDYTMLAGPGGKSYAREHAGGMGLDRESLMAKAQQAQGR